MHHLQPGWRAQSASRHGQLPADISDAIPRREVQRPPLSLPPSVSPSLGQMLESSALVLKLNFIVTLSCCYCTGSASRGPHFTAEDAYESKGICQCAAPNHNSSLSLRVQWVQRWWGSGRHRGSGRATVHLPRENT